MKYKSGVGDNQYQNDEAVLDYINVMDENDDPFDPQDMTEKSPEEAKRGYYTLKMAQDNHFEGGGTDGQMNLIDVQQYPNQNAQLNMSNQQPARHAPGQILERTQNSGN